MSALGWRCHIRTNMAHWFPAEARGAGTLAEPMAPTERSLCGRWMRVGDPPASFHGKCMACSGALDAPDEADAYRESRKPEPMTTTAAPEARRAVLVSVDETAGIERDAEGLPCRLHL